MIRRVTLIGDDGTGAVAPLFCGCPDSLKVTLSQPLE
jgi:hypothetical protein